MTTLHWEMRPLLTHLKPEGRLNVLTALLLHANIRLRCWPSLETLVAETDFTIATVNRAKNWLLQHGFIVLVPYELRVDNERKLPPRQNVYQLTGVANIKGKVFQYLYMTPESYEELRERVEQITAVKSNTLTSKVLTSKALTVKGKGISNSTYKDSSIGKDKDSLSTPNGMEGQTDETQSPSMDQSEYPEHPQTPTPPSSGQPPHPLYQQLVGIVQEVWGHNGGRSFKIAAILAGVSKSKGWKEFNLVPPATPDGVRMFKVWYEGKAKGANFPETPESIQSWYIKMRLAYQKNPDDKIFAAFHHQPTEQEVFDPFEGVN